MPTGKPDFNLNSYGVKYLSKEEVQEFLNKRAGLNVSSSTQTTSEDVEEKKVMGKIKPKGKTPIKQAQPKVDKLGKKIPESVTQESTSTTPSPSITPKEGVFDNVPQTEKDMVTQEGGSSHYKKQPKMPKKELGGKGRYAERVDMELSESKENPVLPKNASDIITEMNIMKLDLMKTQNKFQEVSTEARVGDTKHLKDVRHPEGLTIREATTIDQRTGNTAPLERGDKKSVPKGNKAPKDLGKSADETIFKTISLKLDLTKTLK